jgi:hypothetical protein
MAMLDAFTPDQFSLVTLTAQINKKPYIPGFISRRGLFTEKGVSTTVVSLEEKNEVINLVQTQPRNGPRIAKDRLRRKLRTFQVPHLPEYDYIRADELRDVRAFGSENAAIGVEEVRNDRLEMMAGNLDLTLEYHRVGAIKGLVLDADGSTLIDLYSEFGVSAQTEINFDLDNASPASGVVRKNAAIAQRRILAELGGAEPTGFEALCGDTFFDSLVAHPEVRDTYKYQEGRELRNGYVYGSVTYGGITWINYRNGTDTLVNTDKCHIYPLGVPDLFITRFGPANYFETVNTLGLPRYAKAKADDWDKEIEIEAQTNPLNLCTRPRALQQGRRT